uniref:Uncharacterized protein n=1 Tax=Meloidogyne javanica TaxID=6303 RepID=A0A915MYQ3_MELJA
MRLIQQAGPPANSVTRLTPEKEEENIQKTAEENKALDSIKELTGNIYFAVDNEHDIDYGQNGFLSADRFQSGDCLPLLNDKIQENLDLPKLEICGYGDCNGTRNDSEIKNFNNDVWNLVEEGRALETKGISKIEPNNNWNLYQSNQNNKNIEKESLALKLINNIGINTITTIAPSITSNTTTTTTSTTLGNDRIQVFDHRERTLKKRRKQNSKDKSLIIKPQDEPGYVGHKDVDVIMKAMGFEQPQQSQQRSQKATSPGNGVNIGTSIASNNSSINGNSSTKKQLKKQKQKEQTLPKKEDIIEDTNKSINEVKILEKENKNIDKEKIKEEDLKEEKEILNKNIEEQQNKDTNNNNQQKQVIKQKEGKDNIKAKWTSSKVEEKKRLWKQKIETTPLIQKGGGGGGNSGGGGKGGINNGHLSQTQQQRKQQMATNNSRRAMN